MRSTPESVAVLLVDDDETLRKVLSRVLTDDGYKVLAAAGAAEAIELSQEHSPQVALLDLCLQDGDAIELGHQLHVRQPDLPLLLMTGNPVQLQKHPHLSKQFRRVMTKPVNLDELRRVIRSALNQPAVPQPMEVAATTLKPVPESASVRDSVPAPPPPSQKNQPAPTHHYVPHWLRSAGVVIVAALVLVVFVIYALGIQIPGLSHDSETPTVAASEPLGVKLDRSENSPPHTIFVPDEVLLSLGIRKGSVDRVEEARKPEEMRPLTLYGSTALNPSAWIRIRANFAPTTVLRVGQKEDREGGRTVFRDLRSGDAVKKGDVLAEFYSLDVASRKSDIVDALVQLQIDLDILDRALHSSSVPPIVLEADKNKVRADQSTLDRAKRQLENILGVNAAKQWIEADTSLSSEQKAEAIREVEKDIDEVYREAENLTKMQSEVGDKRLFQLPRRAFRTLRALGTPDTVLAKLGPLQDRKFQGRDELTKSLHSVLNDDEFKLWHTMVVTEASERDPEVERKWATVVIKSPMDGIIIEQNVTPRETIIDNTVNLFQIARTEKLQVIGNVDEHDLPELAKLMDLPPEGRRWTVHTAGAPSGGIPGVISDIGPITDPNQHTAIAKGYIENQGGRLRGGQFASFDVQLPPPPDVVEVPIGAVIDEGDQSLVFVQIDANRYTLRRVKVTHRFDRTAFVMKEFSPVERAQLDSIWKRKEKEEGLSRIEPLKEGEKVLTNGVLLLRKELRDQEAEEH
jgi:CheY-like chemotaxis protein/multidrug efflux pump subunit AcrA (membrane-fusion protein)